MKKVLIIVICVVTIVTAFGLEWRLNSDGILHVFGGDLNGEPVQGMVTYDVMEVAEDFRLIELVSLVVNAYQPGQGIIFRTVTTANETTVFEVWVSYYPNTGAYSPEWQLYGTVEFHSARLAKRALDYLRFIENEDQSVSVFIPSLFDDVLDGINWLFFAIKMFVSCLLFFVTFAFDVLTAIITIVRGGLWLIGF